MQRDYWYATARDPAGLGDIALVGRRAGERAIARLGARRLSTRRAPVLFAPELARGVFGHLVAAIRGSSQYRRSSFLLDAAGQQVLPAFIQLRERPHIPKALASCPFDAEGVVERCGVFDTVERTRIGSPFVIAGMEQLAADGATNIVGFEANGGFLLGTRLERDSRRLAPLPTRDAVLPILALLVRARRQGLPVSALAGELPPRFTASDRIQNFATEKSRMLIRELSGSTAALAAFLAPLGVAAAGLDQTDGLRVTLASGEILHLRPSGNAPELRCYAEAEDQGRANDLVRLGLERVASWRG